ncbi:MAG TPA: cytochrome o ubiquinol oxidase subunit III [Candidatus Saccharimonadales bacterium]|jgi:cytochrome o ubiquinol oxidase subunit 3
MEPSTVAVSAKNLKRQKKEEAQSNILFGFWVYIMTDCVLFASLFATYAVLHNNTFGGPSGAQIFSLPYVLTETMLLLTSSFVCGLATIALQNRSKVKVIGYFIVTFLLGLSFLVMELHEFRRLDLMHDSWTRSGFLSAYFTLVGTHGLHITVGLIWMVIMMVRVAKSGLTSHNVRRLKMLALFWHFLDVIWIFIFSIVYLFGALHV